MLQMKEENDMKKTRLFQAALALLLALSLAACAPTPTADPAPAVSSSAFTGTPSLPADKKDTLHGLPDGNGFLSEVEVTDTTSAEQYRPIVQNPQRATEDQATVTLSLKVDTAAYNNVARYLESGQLPHADAVRTEELVNYFSYDTALEFGEDPFALYTEIGPSPLNPGKLLALLRVKTPEIDRTELPPCNLTFLIDTSGSMDSYDKLPLLKEAFALLVDTLGEYDRVSIVAYAGVSGVVLDSVPGSDKIRILNAIDRLTPGGSTAGANGIQTAYALAAKNFLPDGNNRVILATDGDFNVGISSVDALTTFIAEKRDTGVYLSVLGFGTGNIRDDLMEALATNGNGNYSYLNSVSAAKKVLVEEMGSNLYTVANDVKAQVEFDPAAVKGWRMIGYENRTLANEDFADDTVDAGEIGAGTDVVILFELELNPGAPDNGHLFEARIRYKRPGETESRLVTHCAPYSGLPLQNTADFRWAASVSMLGELLRGSDYAPGATVEAMLSLAQENIGDDPGGYRAEHIALLRDSKALLQLR